MIGFMRGVIEEDNNEQTTIRVNGIGYEVMLPDDFVNPGDEMVVYMHHECRDDSEVLYGFNTVEIRNYFKKLLKIKGIGPSLALKIVGTIPLYVLKTLIEIQNVDPLVSIHGVGPKVANKIMKVKL